MPFHFSWGFFCCCGCSARSTISIYYLEPVFITTVQLSFQLNGERCIVLTAGWPIPELTACVYHSDVYLYAFDKRSSGIDSSDDFFCLRSVIVFTITAIGTTNQLLFRAFFALHSDCAVFLYLFTRSVCTSNSTHIVIETATRRACWTQVLTLLQQITNPFKNELCAKRQPIVKVSKEH